ncbi:MULTISPECIES: polysaccharide pyruvyl transferase family protein [unclassified Vibrio]|uniref:polysaccharide pyruvyl transferase family protein n=1 Tax=unclassified Vibrio TaxID=2614977 RepID=UPI0020A3480F|nr:MULTISPECIES: polysaccharide pyruvyl transferase family protein [unclassified Vibrio]
MSNVTKKIFVLNAQPGGNKGAEAMLETVLHFLTENFQNYKILVESLNDSPAYEAFKNRTNFDIEFIRFSPKNFLSPYEVTVSDVDIAIDIGGINYHDKSIKANLRNYIRHSFFIRNRARLIFFTQDFGPCEKLTTKIFAKLIYRKAEAIFMRSKKSRELLTQTIRSNHIYGPYPDCTLLMKPEENSRIIEEDYFVVSPSAIMYNEYGYEYLSKLADSIVDINAKSIVPVFLVHNFTSNGETSDKEVTSKLFKLCENKGVKGILKNEELSPAQLKQILNGSLFSLTSRYHVVVGSFSCNTPSISIGWSHKYQEFMDLYNCKHLNLNYGGTLSESVLDAVNELTSNNFFNEEIKAKNNLLKNRAEMSFECLKKTIDKS